MKTIMHRVRDELKLRKNLLLFLGIILLVGVFTLPGVLAKNFNVTSNGNDLSHRDDLLLRGPFFVNGSSGDAWFGYNVSAVEDFEKIYKLPNLCSLTDSDIRFIFPGNLRVAGCFHFSKFSGGILW